MSDETEKPRTELEPWQKTIVALQAERDADITIMRGLNEIIADLTAEIARLHELLVSTGANRYWEARWRDEYAENEKLRAEIARLKNWCRQFMEGDSLMAENARLQCELERVRAEFARLTTP
jgi:uncharacterized small protein (DUF1192 family)